ncbi:MAG TPA: hypothetical protein VKF36_01475 [Syntrophorhabdales bacterium]|nr:hypothetical protein [Syntrophorhabdales bacterium]
MATRKWFIGLAITTILVIGTVLLSSVSGARAETLNSKSFIHMTKAQVIPIADVEGHVMIMSEREGAIVFENEEWAWHKGVYIHDAVKGLGPLDGYASYTFLDGSTITTHTKGKTEATAQGVSPLVKWAGEIVSGTGRFQGIKGTVTISTKLLPAEKGEPGPKAFSETTLVYTLPGK